jgi:hypothetical protein
MLAITFPFVNQAGEIAEYRLSWFAIQLTQFEEALSLLDVHCLHLYFVFEVWPVGCNDSEEAVVLSVIKLPTPAS